MSTKSATSSAAPSVKKWVIDSDVENQLRSEALKRRLFDESLSHGSIELYLRCYNLTAIGWNNNQPFNLCPSLLWVDLSGMLSSLGNPECAFSRCCHLVSVIFGEHSNIANVGAGAFQYCYALKRITLPDKLKIIEDMAFSHCTSLKRVVYNKNLKSIGREAFQYCSKLEDA